MTDPKLKIRSATELDIPAIADFIRELAHYEQLSREVKVTEHNLKDALFGKQAVAEAIIASHTELPVGFALFFPSFSTFLGCTGLYLEDLYVVPERRNRGIGRAMMIYLIALAKQRGYGRLEWSVLDWNTPAINLYRSMGAIAMPEWIRYRLSQETLDNFEK